MDHICLFLQSTGMPLSTEGLLFNYAGRIDMHKTLVKAEFLLQRFSIGLRPCLSPFLVLCFAPQKYHMLWVSYTYQVVPQLYNCAQLLPLHAAPLPVPGDHINYPTPIPACSQNGVQTCKPVTVYLHPNINLGASLLHF